MILHVHDQLGNLISRKDLGVMVETKSRPKRSAAIHQHLDRCGAGRDRGRGQLDQRDGRSNR